MTPEDWSRDMASLANWLSQSEPRTVVNKVWELRDEGVKMMYDLNDQARSFLCNRETFEAARAALDDILRSEDGA